jgi:hypothetical protein
VYLLCHSSLTVNTDEKGKSPTYPIKNVRMVLKNFSLQTCMYMFIIIHSMHQFNSNQEKDRRIKENTLTQIEKNRKKNERKNKQK